MLPIGFVLLFRGSRTTWRTWSSMSGLGPERLNQRQLYRIPEQKRPRDIVALVPAFFWAWDGAMRWPAASNIRPVRKVAEGGPCSGLDDSLVREDRLDAIEQDRSRIGGCSPG